VHLYAFYSHWYSFYVFIILHFLLLLLTYIQHNLPPLPHTQCNNNNNNNNNNNPFHQHCRCRGGFVSIELRIRRETTMRLFAAVQSVQLSQFHRTVSKYRHPAYNLASYLQKICLDTRRGFCLIKRSLPKLRLLSPNHARSPYIFSFSLKSPSNAVGITLTP